MRLDPGEARSLFGHVRVARLATVGPDARPHLVPVTFALRDDVVVTAIDHKPKTTTALKRTRNIARNPHVSLLADHYDDDWARLWWVRADGVAALSDAADRPELVAALTSKYAQYRRHPPADTLIVVTVDHFTGWAAS